MSLEELGIDMDIHDLDEIIECISTRRVASLFSKNLDEIKYLQGILERFVDVMDKNCSDYKVHEFTKSLVSFTVSSQAHHCEVKFFNNIIMIFVKNKHEAQHIMNDIKRYMNFIYGSYDVNPCEYNLKERIKEWIDFVIVVDVK